MRSTTRHGWRWRVFRATALATATAMVAPATRVRAADNAPSNLELLTQMTSEVAEELYGKFGPDLGGHAVRLQPFGAGEDYVFVGNVFTNVLTGHGVKTIAAASPGSVARPAAGATGANTNPAPNSGAATLTNPQQMNQAPATASPQAGEPGSTEPGTLVLTFQNVGFAIAYADVYRSHLVGGKRVKRRADVSVHATLTDAVSRQVVWVGEASRERSDEFDYGDAARVEQGAYQFARPVIPGGGLGKYAEPVFVTGIIVGLIYLFFSNQSDN